MAATTHADETHLVIEPVQPFDFEHSLAFLRGFIPCSGDHICSTRTLTTGGYAGDASFVARITEADATALAVDVNWLDDPGDLIEMSAWLRGFLSLDDDLTNLYETAEEDPAFERVVDDLDGYHQVRFSTPFEAACWAALSQRTPMQVAHSQKRALVEACGRVVDIDGGEIPLFPTPEMVRTAAPAVRDAIDNERKTKTILAAADTFANEELTALDDEYLRERLEEIWGFGEWSSEFVALRGFGRLSEIPRTERRLREAVADLYELDTGEAMSISGSSTTRSPSGDCSARTWSTTRSS